MALPSGLKLGALGGPSTFGAQAAQRLKELYPEFAEIVYYPTAEESMDWGSPNAPDAACAPEQMRWTGFHPGIHGSVAPPDSHTYVVAEVTHTYHCCLLVKAGTPLDAIREVQGHTGSITQSQTWLREHLPRARINIVDTSSHGAAQSVVAGDGSLASVGTPEMGREWGLTVLAADIDGGSVANYWALSAHPYFSETPTRVLVTGRFGADGALTDVVLGLAQAGYRLHTVSTSPSKQQLYEYDYVLRFVGAGSLAAVQAALARVPAARLAGAYEARE
ncbi:MAG TPA: prephenate dehydratase domain-containing protein [Chloroflexota bacterium]|jgi:prephenate dehydratase